MESAARREETWGELGPAMRALSPRWRAFVSFYIQGLPKGSAAAAARKAGFASQSSALVATQLASRLLHDHRVIAAIAEEARLIVRAGAPEAARALLALVRNSDHRDHVRGIAMLLARTDPETSRLDVNVTHKLVDSDQEGLEELKAMRELGADRAKMIWAFGENGLARLERLEATDKLQRANAAKIVDDVEYEATDA